MAIERREEAPQQGWFRSAYNWVTKKLGFAPHEVIEPVNYTINAGAALALWVMMMQQVKYDREPNTLGDYAIAGIASYYTTATIGMGLDFLAAIIGQFKLKTAADKLFNTALLAQFVAQGMLIVLGDVFTYAPKAAEKMEGPNLFYGILVATALVTLPSLLKADSAEVDEIIKKLEKAFKSGADEAALRKALGKYADEIFRDSRITEARAAFDQLFNSVSPVSSEQLDREAEVLPDTPPDPKDAYLQEITTVLSEKLADLSEEEKSGLLAKIDALCQWFTDSKGGKAYIIAESGMDYAAVALSLLQFFRAMIVTGEKASIGIDVVKYALTFMAAIGGGVFEYRADSTSARDRHSSALANAAIVVTSSVVTLISLFQITQDNSTALDKVMMGTLGLGLFSGVQAIIATATTKIRAYMEADEPEMDQAAAAEAGISAYNSEHNEDDPLLPKPRESGVQQQEMSTYGAAARYIGGSRPYEDAEFDIRFDTKFPNGRAESMNSNNATATAAACSSQKEEEDGYNHSGSYMSSNSSTYAS